MPDRKIALYWLGVSMDIVAGVVVLLVIVAVILVVIVVNARGDAVGRLRADTPFLGEIDAAAARAGLNPVLLAAIARTESSFNPRASNPSDPSWGLCGITLGAAQQVLGRVPTVAELLTPAVSLQIAAGYLVWMMRAYGYRYPADVGAYNIGPSDYRKAFRLFPNDPDWAGDRQAATVYRDKVLLAMSQLGG